MGQYYYAVSVDKKEYLHPHKYDNGLKIMEHSYIGNNFMMAVEDMLSPGKPWHKTRIVWAGDYGDEDLFLDEKIGETLHHHAYSNFKNVSSEEVVCNYRYIINHSKSQYIDKGESQKKAYSDCPIHPLSIITSNGNGRGGGDFRTNDKLQEHFVGYWAGDIISVDNIVDKSFIRIDIEFKEG